LVERLIQFRLCGHSYPWIGDAALAQECNARVAAEAFQLWTLTIKPDHTATLACEDGNGKPVFAKAGYPRKVGHSVTSGLPSPEAETARKGSLGHSEE
jgi:hypothetical protein